MLTMYTYHTIISYTVIIVFILLFYYSLLMVDRDIPQTESWALCIKTQPLPLHPLLCLWCLKPWMAFCPVLRYISSGLCKTNSEGERRDGVFHDNGEGAGKKGGERSKGWGLERDRWVCCWSLCPCALPGPWGCAAETQAVLFTPAWHPAGRPGHQTCCRCRLGCSLCSCFQSMSCGSKHTLKYLLKITAKNE